MAESSAAGIARTEGESAAQTGGKRTPRRSIPVRPVNNASKDQPALPDRSVPDPVGAVLRFDSGSEGETARLGTMLADVFEPGLVVALVGNLGAGKTRLVRAIAEAAGVDRREINSPTFVLVHEYQGRWPIYHFDTYRLEGADEFAALGAEEYFAAPGISLVEWADRVASLLPSDHLRIAIRATGEATREFEFSATGPLSQRVVGRLAARMACPS